MTPVSYTHLDVYKRQVQIRQSDSDVGVIYPDSTTATNTYAVQGNLLLTTGTETARASSELERPAHFKIS